MQEYQSALNQNFEDMKREFSEKDSLLSSKDTTKYTKAQIEIKRKQLGRIVCEITGISATGRTTLSAETTGPDGANSEKSVGYCSEQLQKKTDIHMYF